MTLLSNYNGMRAPKLRCKNYVALAHWAAPQCREKLRALCLQSLLRVDLPPYPTRAAGAH